ncbi:hypothetical protein KKB28_00415, partial [bacterium]|nr:hypothetical protein [bacterium]
DKQTGFENRAYVAQGAQVSNIVPTVFTGFTLCEVAIISGIEVAQNTQDRFVISFSVRAKVWLAFKLEIP